MGIKIGKSTKKQNLLLVGFLLLSCTFMASGDLFAGSNWLKSGQDALNQLSHSPAAKTSGSLSESEIGAGLKEALQIGSETVVAQLSKTDGFNADPAIHIPLPEKLQTVKKALAKIGQADMLDDLELRLNRAAEEATPETKKLFSSAISEMSIDDVQTIYNGPDDAATQYFRTKMTPELTKKLTPIVEKSLAEVGAVKAYDDIMGQYKNIPFMPNVQEDLNEYVVDKGMDGIFHYLAQEEAAIRSDPAKQATALLQKLFGSR